MSHPSSRAIEAIMRAAPVIPVLVIEDAAHAVPIAEALVAGGLPVLEVTLRTLNTREDSLRLNQLRFDQGVTSALDLRQAQSLTAAARATLAQQQRLRALDANVLTLLVGQPIPPQLLAAAPAAQQEGSPALLADVRR